MVNNMAKKRDDFTNWTLMHKNIPVADVEILEDEGLIIGVTKTHNIEHAPIATVNKQLKDRPDRAALNSWLRGRAIPASRQNLGNLFEKLGVSNGAALSLKSYGLSLSDQYWLKPSHIDIRWESVNFFQNQFSDDTGFLLEDRYDQIPNINIKSPDYSSDGWLQKRWIIQNEKRMLIKAGSGTFEQEPYNEEIASNIMARLNIDHIPYKLTFINNKPYSLCENFVTADTELVTAFRLQSNFKQKNSDSDYNHLLRCCEISGIGNMKHQLEQMMVIDYIIGNTDRHWNNFGFIRNANTLEWQGFAPIYDNGTSLWHDKLETSSFIKSLTFKETHSEQIKLVTDLSWYEPISRQDLIDIIESTLNKNPHINESIHEQRKEMIINGAIKQADFITDLKRESSPIIIPANKHIR